MGLEVQRKEHARRSVHHIKPAGGHSPTALRPMPQPQVQDPFPKQKEAKLGSHSPCSPSQEGDSTPIDSDGGILFLTVEGFPILQAHSSPF